MGVTVMMNTDMGDMGNRGWMDHQSSIVFLLAEDLQYLEEQTDDISVKDHRP